MNTNVLKDRKLSDDELADADLNAVTGGSLAGIGLEIATSVPASASPPAQGGQKCSVRDWY